MSRYAIHSYRLNHSRKFCTDQKRKVSVELNILSGNQNTLYLIFVFITELLDSKLYHSHIGKYSFISQEEVAVFPWCDANEINSFICK